MTYTKGFLTQFQAVEKTEDLENEFLNNLKALTYTFCSPSECWHKFRCKI